MPQNTESIIRQIQNDATVNDMLHDLIDKHKSREGGRQQQLYQRYAQDEAGVPVLSKKFANYEKVHMRIPNDFYGDIVDLKTGYMGNAIVVEIDPGAMGDNEHQMQVDFLDDFATLESTTDQNSELVKMAAAAGKAFRLLYSNDGVAHIMNTDPWECEVFYDASLVTPQAAMRYWQVEEPGVGKPEREMRYRVEWYDETNITYYRETRDGIFVKDMSMPETGDFARSGQQPHFFSGVPLIEFPNNREGLAEPQKAINLIDAYDDVISDATSEVEQLRMAYMWMRGLGMSLDEELENQMTQTGILPMPTDGAAGFIGKDLNGAAPFIQYVLSEIRRNIYSFSKSMDLSEDRGGDMRVIGWQINMLRMEMSAQVTERKFRKSYFRQYRLLTDFWRLNGSPNINSLDLRFTFTRKFPKDIDMEIETLVKASTVLPLETAYGLMSFIDKPDEMAEKFREERPELQNILDQLDNAESEVG